MRIVVNKQSTLSPTYVRTYAVRLRCAPTLRKVVVAMPGSLEFDQATWGNKKTGSLLMLPRTSCYSHPNTTTNEFVHTRAGPFVSESYLWYRSGWPRPAYDGPGLPWEKQPSAHAVKNAQSISDHTAFASLERNAPERLFSSSPKWKAPGGEFSGAWASELLPARPGSVAATMLGVKLPILPTERTSHPTLWQPNPATLLPPRATNNPFATVIGA